MLNLKKSWTQQHVLVSRIIINQIHSAFANFALSKAVLHVLLLLMSVDYVLMIMQYLLTEFVLVQKVKLWILRESVELVVLKTVRVVLKEVIIIVRSVSILSLVMVSVVVNAKKVEGLMKLENVFLVQNIASIVLQEKEIQKFVANAHQLRS